MNGSDQTWLAAFLYYAEPWEGFLIKVVQPFVRSVMEKNMAEQFFFIRYWERGPHIRLRFKGEKEPLESKVKPQLESYFRSYFKEKPSQRDAGRATGAPLTSLTGSPAQWSTAFFRTEMATCGSAPCSTVSADSMDGTGRHSTWKTDSRA